MPIPKHADWLRSTSLNVLKPRSTALKALDDAILKYEQLVNEPNLWRIRNTFEDWKRAKGPTWKMNDRNRTGAITELDIELAKTASYTNYQAAKFTPAELQALAFVRQQRGEVIKNVFRDKTVTFKAARLKDRVVDVGGDVKTNASKAVAYIRTKGKSAEAGPSLKEKIQKKLLDTAKEYFGVQGLEALGTLGGLIISIIEQTALEVTPVVGHIKDGYDLFTGWAKVGSLYIEQHSIAQRGYAIETGVPSAAFDALVKCLKNETRNEAISATNATTSFALKTGLAAVDGGAISGPVVGAASALASLLQTLALLGIEWRATIAVNKELTGGHLDVRLFRTYPLMGCYLLTSATLSDLIPVESFGTPGWMDYIEKMKKGQFDDIHKSAADLIDGSPWEILGLPKRPKKTSLGILQEVKRIWSAASPLADLAH